MCPLHAIIGEQKSGDISLTITMREPRGGEQIHLGEVITLVNYYFTSQVKEDQKD
jgi:hypothetical protein